ncbi:ABC transporter permease [Leptolyngbya sp. PCC 6406]|uniref:ABC transporter permease n=1 Tax=Leptolyngbya sp. PCC 6406 TaxID=1173264 RepID=UPI000481C961|nr:ABC transporter permease [Leptolyngbya sp. PCC 6406]
MTVLRIWVIACNVFLEVIRDRVLYLVALYALVMGAAMLLLPEVAAGAHDKITLDLGLAGIHVLGLLVAIFVGTGLINKEIEKRTVLVLIAKPVSRGEFILGKHLGLAAVLVVLLGLLLVLYLGVLSLSAISYSFTSLLLAVVFTFLEMALLTAVAMLFGVFTSSLLATLMTFAVYLMGHLSTDILALGEISENPTIQRVTSGLYLVLPDLERLNLRNQAVYGLDLLPTTGELLGNLLYGLLYIALLLTLTSAIFARRQF